MVGSGGNAPRVGTKYHVVRLPMLLISVFVSETNLVIDEDYRYPIAAQPVHNFVADHYIQRLD